MTAQIIDLVAYRAQKRRERRTAEEMALAEADLQFIGRVIPCDLSEYAPCSREDARMAAELVKFAKQGAPPAQPCFTDNEMVDLRRLFHNTPNQEYTYEP